MPTPLVVGIAVLVVLVVGWPLADRAVRGGALERAAERRAQDRARLQAEGGDSTASGALGELMDVFQPQRVHLTQEIQRQRTVRQEAPDADPLLRPLELADGTEWHIEGDTTHPDQSDADEEKEVRE